MPAFLQRFALRILALALAAALSPLAWGIGALAGLDGDSPSACDPTLPVQRVVLLRPDPGHQVLLIAPVYHGPRRDFVWLVPTPRLTPAADLFLASEDFIASVMDRTAPVVQVAIADPLAPPDAGSAAPPAAAASPADAPLPVSYLLESMRFRGGQDLCDWLERSGYRPPPGLAAAAGRYVQRDWAFAVIRGHFAASSGRLVQGALPPIGLRMATDRPLLPLGISAAGAPRSTRLQAAVVSSAPLTTDDLPVADVPPQREPKPGQWQGELVPDADPSGLLRLAIVRGPCPYTDLGIESLRWLATQPAVDPASWATLFQGVLPPAALRDLAFRSSDSGPFATRVLQHHQVPVRGLNHLRTPRGRLITLVVLLLAGALVMRLRALSGGQAARGHLASLARAAIYSGGIVALPVALAAVRQHLHQMPGPASFMSGQLPLSLTLLWGAAILLWAAVTLLHVLRNVTACLPSRWGFIILALGLTAPPLVALVIAPPAPMREAAALGFSANLGVAQLAATVGAVALGMLLSFLVTAALADRGRGRRLALEAAVLLLAASLSMPILALAGRGQDPNADALPVSLQRSAALLRDGLLRFQEDLGAVPGELADLAATRAPEHGLDLAANAVPLSAGRAQGPYVDPLPPDPLTGRPDTWLYSPLLPGLLASGGLDVTITAPTAEAGHAPEPAAYWAVPRPVDVRQAIGSVGPLVWSSTEGFTRFGLTDAGQFVAQAVDINRLRAAVLTGDQAARIRGLRLAAAAEGTSLLIACDVTRPPASPDAPASPRCAVFESDNGGHRITPLSPPLRGQIGALACSPDGLWVCATVDGPGGPGGLYLLGSDGLWQGPLGQAVARVAWHPSGAYVLALAAIPTAGASDKPLYQLLRIWPDGRQEPLAEKRRFQSTLLCCSQDEAFCADDEGRAVAIGLANGTLRRLRARGRVLDGLHLSQDRLAFLVRRPAEDEKPERLAVLITDRSAGDSTFTEPELPQDTAWAGGQVIGLHQPTGYLFIHVWPDSGPPGKVFLVGKDGKPTQEVPQ